MLNYLMLRYLLLHFKMLHYFMLSQSAGKILEKCFCGRKFK